MAKLECSVISTIIQKYIFLFQINLILVKYGKAKLFSHFHNSTIVLVSMNSTLNPFIYALWGRQFRIGIKSALCRCIDHTTKSDVTLNSGQEGSYGLSCTSGQNNNAFEISNM